MNAIAKYRLPLLILVIGAVAAGAGLYIANAMKHKNEPVKKVAVPAIQFADQFIVNLADTDSESLIKLSVAVKLEPMPQEELDAFAAAPAGHGGGDKTTGPMRVAVDPSLRAAVNRVVSTFTYDELRTPKGRADLEQRLLAEFDKVAEEELPTKHEGHIDPAFPPYHVESVVFPDFVLVPGAS